MDAAEAMRKLDAGDYKDEEELVELLKIRLAEFRENEKKGKVYTLAQLRKMGYDL